LSEIGKLADRHPDLRIAVDHLGLFVEYMGSTEGVESDE
jgi:predicted TIM-barrel fold metal-dependent hydrolase